MIPSFSRTLQILTNRTTVQALAGGWMMTEIYKLTTNPNNVQVREELPQNEKTPSSIKRPGSS